MARTYTPDQAQDVLKKIVAYELYAAQQSLENAVGMLRATEVVNKHYQDALKRSDLGLLQQRAQALKRALKGRVTSLAKGPQNIPCEGGVMCNVANRPPEKIKIELNVVIDALRMSDIPDALQQQIIQRLTDYTLSKSAQAPMTVKFEASLTAMN